MPELMARSDLAISAGGGTCDELAFLRVPMFLIAIAKNQEQAVEAYGRNKVAVVAGRLTVLNRGGLAASLRKVIVDKNLRSEISAKAGKLVDGQGACRVVEAMRGVGAGATR
jgi:spore coat polysaccharide biosynthesis predicted glycosyltransferase SpsG